MRDPRGLGSGPVLFVDDLDRPGLGERELHHLRDVRRVRDGEVITLGDGNGFLQAFEVRKEEGEGRRRGGAISLEALDARFFEPPPEVPVRIATFLPSLDRLSVLLTKVTEVGADEIHLLVDGRDRRGGEPAGSLDRWRRTVTEAASQSKRAYIPTIYPAKSLSEFLTSHRDGAVLCEPSAEAVLGEGVPIAVIGPESGLDPAEVGLPTARLPGNILRIETAAIVAAALLVVERERIVVRRQK